MVSPLALQIPSPAASPIPFSSPSSSSSSFSSASSASTPSPIIFQEVFANRLSPNAQSIEKSLSWAVDLEGERLLLLISTIVSDIIAICDSFVPENIPDVWKKKFATIQNEVKPIHLQGVNILCFNKKSGEYLAQTFPNLKPVFKKVQSIAFVAIKQENK